MYQIKKQIEGTIIIRNKVLKESLKDTSQIFFAKELQINKTKEKKIIRQNLNQSVEKYFFYIYSKIVKMMKETKQSFKKLIYDIFIKLIYIFLHNQTLCRITKAVWRWPPLESVLNQLIDYYIYIQLQKTYYKSKMQNKSPYFKVQNRKSTQEKHSVIFEPIKLHTNQENQKIDTQFMMNSYQQILKKDNDLPSFYEFLEFLIKYVSQLIMKYFYSQDDTNIKGQAFSINLLLQLNKYFQFFQSQKKEILQSEQKLKSDHSIEEIKIYSLKNKIKKTQYLTNLQKMKRAKQICNEKKYLNIKFFGSKMSECHFEKTYDNDQYLQYQTIAELIRLVKNQNFKNKKRHKQNWNVLSVRCSDFLLNFYKNFKESYSFYPPTPHLKYIRYHRKTRDFSLDPVYILNWTLGLIEQPMSMQQKIVFSETPQNQTSNIMMNPLINHNPWERVQTQSLQKYVSNVPNELKQFCLYLYKLKKQLNLSSESELLRFKIQKSTINNTINLEELIPLYNCYMLMYEIRNLRIFPIQNFLQMLGKYKKEMTYSQAKIQLIYHLLYEQDQLKNMKDFVIGKIDHKLQIQKKQEENNFSSHTQQIQIQANQLEIQKRKERKKYQKLVLRIFRNLGFSQSSFLVIVHNAIRYFLIYLIGLLYEIHHNLSFQNILDFENTENTYFKQKKINAYRQKSFQKLINYQESHQFTQNKEILTKDAKSTMQFIKEINKISLDQTQRKTLFQIQQKAIKEILFIVNKFVFRQNIFVFKNLEMKYHQISLHERQIDRFIIEAIVLNYDILKILNQSFQFRSSENQESMKRIQQLQMQMEDIFQFDFQQIYKNSKEENIQILRQLLQQCEKIETLQKNNNKEPLNFMIFGPNVYTNLSNCLRKFENKIGENRIKSENIQKWHRSLQKRNYQDYKKNFCQLTYAGERSQQQKDLADKFREGSKK